MLRAGELWGWVFRDNLFPRITNDCCLLHITGTIS
uniref:Uncharacterized protein n=1 Tax=Arundo donax TaxID=35708 RepID=A0A0A9D8H8_ARUDO